MGGPSPKKAQDDNPYALAFSGRAYFGRSHSHERLCHTTFQGLCLWKKLVHVTLLERLKGLEQTIRSVTSFSVS